MHANLESADNDLDLAHSELGVVHSKLESIRADKESMDWIIETLESQVRRNRHDVSQLRKEHDNCV